MLTYDVLCGLVALAVALLAWAEILEVWHIYLASRLFGLLDAFFQSA